MMNQFAIWKTEQGPILVDCDSSRQYTTWGFWGKVKDL